MNRVRGATRAKARELRYLDKNAWPKESRITKSGKIGSPKSWEAHHIIPLEFGGPNVWWNIIPVKHIKHRGKDGLHYKKDFIKLFGKPGERK